MLAAESALVSHLSGRRAERVGAYRFLHNDSVTIDALTGALTSALAPLVEGRHVLAIEDTTEINYAAHAGALRRNDPELGPLGNNVDVGFFLHPTLVLDAGSGFALGLADVEVWNRRWGQPGKRERAYRSQPVEQKESYRWIKCACRSKQVLRQAERVTLVCDREADIYELLARVPDERTHLVVRAMVNRRCAPVEGAPVEGAPVEGAPVEGAPVEGAPVERLFERLFEHLSASPVHGTYDFAVEQSAKHQKRTAHVEVRYGRVRLEKPRALVHTGSLPEAVEFYAVEVREQEETVPPSEEPICWRLLTTHRVESMEEARAVVGYYRSRWQVEQLFRLLKSEGLRLEASQLEEGLALKRLSLMSLHVALVILQLVTGRSGEPAEEGSIIFSDEALAMLRQVQPGVEGRTQKQQCPHAAGSLAWAAWIVARLGHWDGYACSRAPGVRTMRWGLEKLESLFAGWCLHSGRQAQFYRWQTRKDVCIP